MVEKRFCFTLFLFTAIVSLALYEPLNTVTTLTLSVKILSCKNLSPGQILLKLSHKLIFFVGGNVHNTAKFLLLHPQVFHE